ncbi:conserved hypothetical protein [Histoplasma capsulatum var. duboisii H88]|uniref:Uncharacterized protein n=2 Tax=Ajellomyces capsulatus TaxID=5037 RepID=F0U4X7_AJEC8|nr:conserved hypothetical protein [Histoplasma capsulatum H143]EGC42020.1 conserved hypothetical protein [Histoplasma capsulatum var. duboisii H88]QSS51554.1 hypothetical protein I7I53_06910 [Histoplasma capsulatum var. duboisii H88]
MIPVYHAHQIHVPTDANLTSLPAVPQKAFIHGVPNPSFFNIVYTGDVGMGYHELLAYSKIHTTKSNATVHMSQLNGLIEDGNGHVEGLLLSYIIVVDRHSITLIDMIPSIPNFGKSGMTKFPIHWSVFIHMILSGEMQKLPMC